MATETMRKLKLEEILTEKQLTELKQVCIPIEHEAPMSPEFVKPIADYFDSISEHLLAQEILPGYLTFFVAFQLAAVLTAMKEARKLTEEGAAQ